MFITFEGIEGSGKSTQAKLLKQNLEERGYKVSLTREPGWGTIGNLIRKLILEERDLDIHPYTELCLFCADRAQHVADYIKPKLANNEIVICDRFTDSTIVYQGYGRKLDTYFVKKMAEASALELKPDITFLLNLPVKTGLKRLQERGEITKLDEEPFEFHELIRQGYISEANLNKNRIKIINADASVEEIQSKILTLLDEYIKAV